MAVRIAAFCFLILAFDSRAFEGESKLFQAARNGDKQQVDALLLSGIDPNEPDDTGATALMAAAWGRNADVVEALIRCGAKLDSRTALEGHTALMIAVIAMNIEIAHLLIARGANPNEIDAYEGTALNYAVRADRIDLARLLIDSGANMKSRSAGLALLDAAGNGNLYLTRLLLHSGARIKSVDNLDGLQTAYEDPEIARELINGGTDVNAVDKHRRTALHWACRLGNKDVVAILLHAGAKIDATDIDGRTPFILAASENQVETAKQLIDAGANPGVVDKTGCSALNYASEGKFEELTRFLIENGATPGSKCKQETSTQRTQKELTKRSQNELDEALMNACVEGSEAEVLALLRSGANPNATSNNGFETPLLLAAGERSPNVIEALIRPIPIFIIVCWGFLR